MNRLHPRASIELKVVYKRMNAFFADYTRDISKGGISIRTEEPLPMGSELDFSVTLPKRPRPIALKGRVAWTDAERGMGIQFTWSDDQERLAFEKVVEEMMVEALGVDLYKKLLDKGRE